MKCKEEMRSAQVFCAGTFLATTDTGHMIPKKFLKPPQRMEKCSERKLSGSWQNSFVSVPIKTLYC